jgi:very-short-patch-repair endonuclease
MDTKTCEQCGEQFQRPSYLSQTNWTKRRYCGMACYRAAVDHPRHCPICGDRFRQRYGGQATCRKKECQVEYARTVSGPAAAERMRSDYAAGRRRVSPGISPRETALWPLLREHGWVWRLRWIEQSAEFELDFAHRDLMLNVEIDGVEHREPRGIRRDAVRDAALAEQGWRVLRIDNADVDADPEAVADRIAKWARDSRGRAPSSA